MLAMGLIHDGAQLVEREGWNVIQHAIWPDKIAAIGINLDPVSAVANLLADSLASIFYTIHYLHAMRHWHFRRISLQRIRAGYIHGARSDPHARSRNNAIVDGFLQVNIGVPGAFGFKIANGGKAVPQLSPG